MGLLGVYGKIVELIARPSRQYAAVAAYRNAEGRCLECNAKPVDHGGICEDCWIEQHAGP